ncbi:MAG: hypothetical protein AAFU58_06565, partial [Pseudomonadota bacterium]
KSSNCYIFIIVRDGLSYFSHIEAVSCKQLVIIYIPLSGDWQSGEANGVSLPHALFVSPPSGGVRCVSRDKLLP